MHNFDREFFGENKAVLGIDEVGRGPLAGDVVVCGIVMDLSEGKIIDGVNDSKKLTKRKRDMLFDKILTNAIEVSIQRATPAEIDEINILNATKNCMKRAIEEISTPVDAVLVDYVDLKQDKVVPIVKGDAKSYTIACASIVAKVTRDREMEVLAEVYPHYAFEKNMGYGTKAHSEGIIKHGLCEIHRRSFTRKFWEEK
ncbi:MAG: ribonuclease HII [Bacillota bacterium]